MEEWGTATHGSDLELSFYATVDLEHELGEEGVNYVWLRDDRVPIAVALMARVPHTYALSHGAQGVHDYLFTTTDFLESLVTRCDDDRAVYEALCAIMPLSVRWVCDLWDDAGVCKEALHRGQRWVSWLLETNEGAAEACYLPPTQKRPKKRAKNGLQDRVRLCTALFGFAGEAFTREGFIAVCDSINARCATKWMPDSMLHVYTDWECGSDGRWRIGIPGDVEVMLEFIRAGLVNEDNNSGVCHQVGLCRVDYWDNVVTEEAIRKVLGEATRCDAFTEAQQAELLCMLFDLGLSDGEGEEDDEYTLCEVDFDSMSLSELAKAPFDEDPTNAFLSIQKRCASLLTHGNGGSRAQLALLTAATDATCFSSNQETQLQRFLTAWYGGGDASTHGHVQDTQVEFITKLARAKAVCSTLMSWECTAVDCEFGQWQRLALVQVSNGDVTYVFDVAANAKVLKPLRAFLDSTSCVKVMHDCRGDARVLASRGYRLRHVVDLQLLWNVCFRTRETVSLNTLLGRLVPDQVNVHKDAVKGMYARNPNVWMKRPLSQQLREYAVADVSHLLAAVCELNPLHGQLMDVAKRSHQRVYNACGRDNKLGLQASLTDSLAKNVANKLYSFWG